MPSEQDVCPDALKGAVWWEYVGRAVSGGQAGDLLTYCRELSETAQSSCCTRV